MEIMDEVFLLTTTSTELHYMYDDFMHNGIYYLGFTTDTETAEIYAKQFSSWKKVYYYPTKMGLVKYIQEKIKIPITQITLWENPKGKDYAFSDAEIEFMDEFLADCAASEFDDLDYTIENLSRFNHKYIKKCLKMLKHIRSVTCSETEDSEEEMQDYIDSIDLTKHYAFLARRIGIFDYYSNKVDKS